MKVCPVCLHENYNESDLCQSCGYIFDSSIDSAKTWYGDVQPSSRFEPGDIIGGRYLVERILGKGGMGVVYLVRDQALRDNRIALKMIHPGLVDNTEALQRFEEEILISQSLTHANIVRVHDLKRADALRFFTMEYLEGRSLREWMTDRKKQHTVFSVQESALIIGQTLKALDYAHQYTVHRDIKPENIMVIGNFPEVTVKLLDFGIARTMSHPHFTQASQVLGTAYYMAPEQLQNASAIDHRADLYAVGMVFFEMLTGRMAVGRFALPGESITGIPEAIDIFVDKSLAPEPENRFQDAGEMGDLLEIAARQAVAELDVKSESPAPEIVKFHPKEEDIKKPSTPEPAGRKRALLWLIPFTALLCGVAWFVFLFWSKTPVLTVASKPSAATVYVDDNPVGQTPIKMKKLADGTHRIRIVKKRFAEHEESIIIRQNANVNLDVELNPLPIGDLKISSSPDGASIKVDGKRHGKTPAVIEMLPEGKKNIVLEKENFEPWQGQVDIVPLETASLKAKLVSSFGTLKVTTDPPGAEIYLDGNKAGPSPVVIDWVMKGDHTVTAKLPEYDDLTQSVTIQPSKQKHTQLKLISTYGSLQITSTPNGANVFLNGKKIGTSPLFLEKVKKGSHQVSAQKECHAESTKQVSIASEKMSAISMALQTTCGSAEVTSDPPGAIVFLDGENIGQTPLQVANLASGNRMLRFEKKYFPAREETIEITAGKQVKFTVSLSRQWTEPFTGMVFLWVPEGCFQMGCGDWSNKCSMDELPVHEVCLDGFWMSKTEVTQGQWEKVMNTNPSFFKKGNDFPVEQVSWKDAKAFIKKLNTKNKGGYRLELPSEAQWEYAARSGGKEEQYAGGSDLEPLAWYNANSGGASHKVGSKKPNGLGLFDMSGNVWEWCEDVYHDLAYTEHGRANPLVTTGEDIRVRRGAGWFDSPRDVRSTSRAWNDPNYKISFVGFRLIAR
jgi:formylglycine-generating enzyme required for sulfatase activity/serine/threonine protein kinase